MSQQTSHQTARDPGLQPGEYVAVPPRRPNALERILGGKPSSVVIRLVIISLVVGFIMSVLGLDAEGIFRGAVEFIRETIGDSGGLLRATGGYILTGAALVLPIWLVMRLTAQRK